MTASNLAICVGPSLLWSTDSAVMLDPAYSKQVSAIAQVLIEQYADVFGDATPAVYAEADDVVETGKPKSVVVGRSEFEIILPLGRFSLPIGHFWLELEMGFASDFCQRELRRKTPIVVVLSTFPLHCNL